MKILLLGIAFIIASSLTAQKPETVYSIAREVKEISWYETQQRLWKEILDKNNKDGNAWMNYYAATRALRNLSDGETKKKYTDQAAEISKSVATAMPGSFESYFIAYIDDQGIAGSPDNLLKAAAIRPDDVQIFDELMIYYEIIGDKKNYEKYAQKMFQANEMPVGMLNWGYNVLAGLDQNAILLVVGDNDTYAAWIVQAAKDFRKDVAVINTSLIQLDDYRNRIFKELGYSELNVSLDNAKTQEEADANYEAIFTHFFAGNRPVYAATTAAGQFIEKHEKNLYLTGLAYKYSTESFDNSSIIKRNYEKRYQLDYLTQVFAWNIGDEQALQFNGMYLASMIKLYQLYSKSEDLVRKSKLEELMIRVAEQTGQQSEVFDILGNNEKAATFLTTVLDIKTLEKNMIPVSGKTYMDKYEVSNAEYNKFLSNLQRSGQTELYAMALYDSTQWTKKFPADFMDPMTDMYNWHPAYGNYPVVNISWDAANAYCAWLTKQYNLQRQRKYTQVLFRLPTEKEWKTAAGSGNASAKTPFPNDMVRNSKGNYLGNYQPEKGKFFEDGGFHTVHVNSYFPNNSGFYNAFGNVSEMTASKGKALGGSWYSLYEEATFDKTQAYDGPDPGVGFRIVMEIIEE